MLLPLWETSSEMTKTLIPLLLLLAGIHFLVDTFACLMQPLWPDLEKRLELGLGSVLWLFALWSLTTSFGQLGFGLLADRFPTRWWIWTMPAIAIVCLSCLGLSESPFITALVLVIGGLAIAAFHPEAAATAGACFPDHRSQAMSVFALAGYLGQSFGPLYSGFVTEKFGYGGLIWGIAWGLGILLLIAIGLGRCEFPQRVVYQSTPKVRELIGGKWKVVCLLVLTGTLRVGVVLGVPLALAFVLDSRQASFSETGQVLSAFMFGIGAGGIACALFIRRKNERFVLWLFPLLSIPILVTLGLLKGLLLSLAVATTGLLIGITLPIFISYGQQLLPERQRVASSLTMGVTWGIGSALIAGMMWLLRRSGHVEWSFAIYGVMVLVSGIFCLLLPHLPLPTRRSESGL